MRWRLIVAATLIGASSLAGSSGIYGFGATQFFWPLGGQFGLWGVGSATEAQNENLLRGGGSFTGFAVNVIANAYAPTANIVCGTRISGANGNLTTTTAAGATGIFTDTTHTDTIANGTVYDWYQTYPTQFNKAFTVTTVVVAYSATTGTGAMYGWSAATASGTTASAASTNYFSPGVGGTASGAAGEVTTEGVANEELVRAAGTLSNMGRRILTNGNTNTATLTSRINAAAGNQTISIGAGTTGFVEDTTHSDAIAAGNTIDQRLATGAAKVNLVTLLDQFLFVPTGTSFDVFGEISLAQCGFAQGGVSNYVPIFGNNFTPTGTETNAQMPSLFAINAISHLRAQIPSNSSTTAPAMWFRKNGGNANETLTIGAGATGTFEDTTHTDSTIVGDKMAISMINASANNTVTVNWTGLTLDAVGAPANPRIPRRWLWILG